MPFGDGDKRALGGVVRTFLTGAAKQQTSPFKDTLGEGRKTVLGHAIEEAGLELEMALFCYDRLPLLGLEAEVRNVGRHDYPLAEIILGEARADHGDVFQLDSEFYDVAARPFLWRSRTVATPVEGNRTWCSLCAIAGLSFLVGTDRHVTGAFAVESSAFDAESATLRGRSAGPPHFTTRLYVHLPPAWRWPPLETENCEAEPVDVDCLRLNVVFPDSGRCDWSVVLDRKAVIR